MKTLGILGLGSWGTAVAIHLARSGHDVLGWARDGLQRDAMREQKENRKYLPDAPFPDLLQVIDSPVEVIERSDWVVWGVPSHALRESARTWCKELRGKPQVNLAKGLEERTLARMLEVLHSELGDDSPHVSLVGPSHAEEVVRDYPTAVVATSKDFSAAEEVQELFSAGVFRVYTNSDTVGVELGVSTKNVIALAAGISAGLGFGDNTLGSLVTRGLAEMTRLGVAQGARQETFFGLAGVGDLVTTCASRHSRNRRVGERIGQGASLEEALKELGMVAEGVRTTRATNALAKQAGVEMPIVEQVHKVLFENKNPRDGLSDLMTREPRAEGGDS